MARCLHDALKTPSATQAFSTYFPRSSEDELQRKHSNSAAQSFGHRQKQQPMEGYWCWCASKCPKTQPSLLRIQDSISPFGPTLLFTHPLLCTTVPVHPLLRQLSPAPTLTSRHPPCFSRVRNISIVYCLSKISSSTAKLTSPLTPPTKPSTNLC